MMRAFILWICGIGMVGLASLSCVNFYEPKPEKANYPPNTTMANLPVENDTASALLSLSWDGEDDDGFVVAYQYQYTTYPLGAASGDSVVHDWVHTEEQHATISFTSPDDINRQHFKVRAIDNSGNVDPTPASRAFFTTRTTAPTTKILSPRTGTEFFATEQTNYWFPGVVVTVSGEDRDGFIAEYGWAVDDGEWHWVRRQDSVITIKPADFKPPLTGVHTIKATSRDNTLLVDPVGASITLELVQPTFAKDILVLDDTREDVSLRNVADAVVDAFYLEIFGHNNSYVIEERNMQTRAFPSLKILGTYKLVVWHGDDSKVPFYLTNPVAIRAIKDYLHVGGDLILCGTRIWDPWLPPADPIVGLPHPLPFDEGSFVRDYLHINVGELSSFEGTFTGAAGVGEFSDVAIDSSKMNTAYPQNGKPHLVQCVVDKGPFTREILTFTADDPYAKGLPCAMRYYGDTYDIAFIGFPMWALKLDDARTLAQQLLRSMDY